ncbi:MAG: NAD(P)-dependent oxidoreductase [Parvularculaceae bacterium]
MAKIAFIGLGRMGRPMAANLVKAGHEAIATDLSIGAIDRAVEAGCARGDTVAAAVGNADIVVTMLPADPHVCSVYLDRYGVLAHARKGALLIDCSTVDIETARALGAAAAEKGFAMIDAPATGGVAEAGAGTLAFTVGGEKDAFARARPVLEAMGELIVHAGPAGAGQAAAKQPQGDS